MPSDYEHRNRHIGSSALSYAATKRIFYRSWVPILCTLVVIVLYSIGEVSEPKKPVVPNEEEITGRPLEQRQSTKPLKGIRVVLQKDETPGTTDASEVEFVYETPETLNPSVRTKAILFMGHGCSHAATDMFDRSESCPKCIGLPIEKRIVRAALARGFAVLAVTSKNRYQPMRTTLTCRSLSLFLCFHPCSLALARSLSLPCPSLDLGVCTLHNCSLPLSPLPSPPSLLLPSLATLPLS
jgi:hypothetical protein